MTHRYSLRTSDSNTLIHYGVLGMKWGVRHDREKAIRKATKKLMRLNDKSPRRAAKWARKMNRVLAPHTKSPITNKNAVDNVYKRYGVRIENERKSETNHQTSSTPDVYSMSTQEIRDRINRINTIRDYNALMTPPKKESRAKQMVTNALYTIGENTMKNVGTKMATHYTYVLLENTLGKETANKIKSFGQAGEGDKKQNKKQNK